MGGKWSWVLAAALGWAGGPNAWAQAPTSEAKEQLAPMTAPSAEAPTPSAQVAPSVLSTEEMPARAGWYAGADYLFWWIKRGPLPEQPLVTTASQAVYNPNAGIFFPPGVKSDTQPLFGGSNGLDWGGNSGVSLVLGYNFSEDGNWGVEAKGFYLPRQSFNFSAASTGSGTPLITLPFFDNVNHAESTYDVSTMTFGNLGMFVPGDFITGSVNINATTEFWGYEFNLTHHLVTANGADLDFYFGFRSLGLDENLQINTASTPSQGNLVSFEKTPIDAGNQYTTMDFFGATNRFYGPQVGAEYNWTLGRLTASLVGKLAAGINHQTVTINGSSTLSGTQSMQAVGGIFAEPTNIGYYARDVFCLVPELGLKLDFAVKPWLHLHCGFDVLYWSSVVRPGSQIDRNIDVTQMPTNQFFNAAMPVSRPAFTFRDSDFWAEGFNVGVEVRY